MSNSAFASRDDLLEAIKKALRLYHKDSREGIPLRDLCLYQKLRLHARNDRQAENQLLMDAVMKLHKEHRQEAEIIIENHFDGKAMKEIAFKIGLGEAATYERKRRGIEWLTDIIWEDEMRCRSEGDEPNSCPIPPPEEPVIGAQVHINALWEAVSAKDAPYLYALVGLGGIGKTTLAQLLVRQLWQRHITNKVAWVSAKPANFPIAGSITPLRPALTTEAMVESLYLQVLGEAAVLPFSYKLALTELRTRLKAEPYYIVVDNLETMQDFKVLLPLLRELANPTKFILTTRDSLHGELDIYHYSVPELNEPDALALIRALATNARLTHLAQLSNVELQPIYTTVGGNPLALRLVVGQSHLHDLARILRDLIAGKGKAGEFYSYVYRRAWENLDETSRRAWLATTTLPATGGTYEQWHRASMLSDEEMDKALPHLIMLNLVDARITANEAKYSIHSLTRTFLLKGIADW